MRITVWQTALLAGLWLTPAGFGDDGNRLLRIDHYVQLHSTVPAIAGQATQIYVREVVEAATVLRGGPAADRVALFIHGAGTPAEVAFDVPYQDYSWMAYLAHAGYDVFSMDMTGYGRSTRPAVDERSLQSGPRAAGGICAGSNPCGLCRELPASNDDARFGLARYRRRSGPRSRSAACGEVERTGLVLGRAALGGICGAASGQSGETGVAGSCL